jgi:YesN/AraC family two-component response regulator
MDESMLRIVVVDDERPARELLLTLLHQFDDVVIVGVEASGEDALATILETRPDVVFLDIQMPDLDGFCVVHLLEESPTPLVVFVSASADYMELAREVGVFDYLLKPIDGRHVQRTLTGVRRQLARSAPDTPRAAQAPDQF